MLLLELVDEEWSSLGAIAGRRSCCFAEASTLLLPCITNVVTIVMSDLLDSSTQQVGCGAYLSKVIIWKLRLPCGKRASWIR